MHNLDVLIKRLTERLEEIKNGKAVEPVTYATIAIILDMMRDIATELKEVQDTLTSGYTRIK